MFNLFLTLFFLQLFFLFVFLYLFNNLRFIGWWTSFRLLGCSFQFSGLIVPQIDIYHQRLLIFGISLVKIGISINMSLGLDPINYTNLGHFKIFAINLFHQSIILLKP